MKLYILYSLALFCAYAGASKAVAPEKKALTIESLLTYRKKIICPTCQELKQKSTVTAGGCQSHAVAHVDSYDEDGNLIPSSRGNDDTWCNYTCSKGHSFSIPWGSQ